jgi:hypothetical protein
MEKKFVIEVSESYIEVLYQGLLELPAKLALPVMKELERQFNDQKKSKTKDEATVK